MGAGGVSVSGGPGIVGIPLPERRGAVGVFGMFVGGAGAGFSALGPPGMVGSVGSGSVGSGSVGSGSELSGGGAVIVSDGCWLMRMRVARSSFICLT